MSKASEKSLSELHGVLADTLRTAITEGITEVTKEGEVVTVMAPAAILNVARQFLKDNKIECLPGGGGKFDSLVDTIASLGADDDEDYPRH